MVHFDSADLIERAWAETVAAREVVEALDKFDGIADLRTEWQLPPLEFKVWRELSTTYVAWAGLQRERGELVAAAKSLSKLESVAKKTMSYNRMIWGKITMVVVHNDASGAAYELVVDPRCTLHVLDQLSVFQQPISEEMTSLGVAVLGDCLSVENAISDDFLDTTMREHPLAWIAIPVVHAGLKPETGRRMVRAYYDEAIRLAAQVPPDSARLEAHHTEFENGPRFPGLVPWYICRAAFPNISSAVLSCGKARVLSEKLALEINYGQGGTLSYPDFFQGPPYRREANRWTSAGPDQSFGTEDDIVLGGNESHP